MAASITIAQLSNLGSPRVPRVGDKVFKDECVFCFENTERVNGLYICMTSFLGFCKEHVTRHYQKTTSPLYLNSKITKSKKPKEETEKQEKKPTKLAIGVDGGFDVEDENLYDIEEHNTLIVLPDFAEFSLPNPNLPSKFQDSITGIIAADSASKQEEVAAWDGDNKFISKHAENLRQLDNGVKISPGSWKCSKCDLKDNIWLNLTDGTVLCGRKYFDGTGGNNHAVDYFSEAGYPLAVKLGTITPNGADVYSYDEDAMVDDPYLARHLSHFGINMMLMKKTDKTMTELEIDLNTRVWEWDAIQEAGCKLKALYGPGYTGLKNLGNSCYMNSVFQVLFSIPNFVERYANQVEAIFNAAPADATGDFNVQMAKLGHGLMSGKFSQESDVGEGGETEKSQDGIAPRMLKVLVGRGHQEFATSRQQDAFEYLLHLYALIERNSRGHSNPCDAFKFEIEERIECAQSKQVRYTRRNDYVLSLPVALEAATNKDDVIAHDRKVKEMKSRSVDEKSRLGHAPRLKIPFLSCLEKFAAAESVEDFFSPATQTKGIAIRTSKFATFPDYLTIHVRKFTLGDDWVPKKLDVSIDMPEELDLMSYRSQGLQDGETELPEFSAEASAIEEPAIDESVVEQLIGMGFNREGCRKAVYHTKNCGTEAAMNWVLEHMDDADFSEPLQLGNSKKKQKTEQPIDEESLVMIESMGFTREQATKALRATDNNVERAVEWIFSHIDELNSEAMDTEEEAAAAAAPSTSAHQSHCSDGSGKYKLMAFISHMGTSTSSGHYVCHILKEGRWVIFNDRKVAQSEKPPKDLGYLYFYQRK